VSLDDYYENVHAVPCPICLARAGAPCTWGDPRYTAPLIHPTRIRAAASALARHATSDECAKVGALFRDCGCGAAYTGDRERGTTLTEIPLGPTTVLRLVAPADPLGTRDALEE
jgi:hypothetical protein